MEKYPKVIVDLNKLRHNARSVIEICKDRGIDVAAVTKAYCANPKIVQGVIDGGVKLLADSRIQNLMKLKDIKAIKILLRLPMLSEVEEVVKYCDISLNSELKTIEELSRVAVKENKIHKIILMVDLGDLREGVWPSDAIDTARKIIKMKGIQLVGLGTNLTCYGGVIPTKDNLSQLSDICKEIEEELGLELKILSGGNSSSMHLIQNGEIPARINNIRLGEAIIFGTEAAYGNILPNTFQDVFTLAAQIVEIKNKPSIPIGEIGVDAFGNKPVFEDNGIRKRAILAIGKQDIYPEKLIPVDRSIKILGASSDHLIVDITETHEHYNIGDEIRFNLKYPALLQLFTSEYVYKEIK